MIRIGTALITLCAIGICAQSSMAVAQSAQTQPKHYRLTFVLSYTQGKQPSQTIVLDVPVTHGRSGMAATTVLSGLAGEPEGNLQESLQCTDVQESATGLAAKVVFSVDSMGQPLPGSEEPRHHNLTFNRQIDVALGTPTRITEELHVIPLGKTGAAYANTLPPAPQITVTAVEM